MIFGEILGSTVVAAWGKGEITALIKRGGGVGEKHCSFCFFFWNGGMGVVKNLTRTFILWGPQNCVVVTKKTLFSAPQTLEKHFFFLALY